MDTPVEYHEKEWLNFVLMGIYYGIVVMSILYNVIFFFIFQEKRFILYAAFLVSIFALFAFEDGLVSFFITNKFILNNFATLTSPITTITASYFCYYLLDLKNNYPLFKRIVLPLNLGSLVLSILYLLIPHISIFILANFTYFGSTFMCCVAAVVLFKKDVLARFIIFTLGIVLIFGLGYLLYQLGVFENDFFNRTTFQLASSFEIITISFAIVYKVRKMLLENIQFRQEIINYIREIDEFKKQKESKEENDYQVILNSLTETYDLTEREADVLKGILNGLTNKDIADQLYISLSTVKFHISNIYLKLDIKNRSQALKLIQWS